MVWSLKLEAPGLNTLDFGEPGWHVEDVDLGHAGPRTTASDAVDADGTIDTTSLSGSRSIAVRVSATPDATDVESMQRRLKAFTNLRLRPTLHVTRSQGTERIATVRFERWSEQLSDQMGTFIAQWVVPSGILESAEQHSATATASGDPEELGFTFDLEFDLTFPAMDPQGSVQIVNSGDRDAYPLIRLYGPWSDEVSISNDTSGKALVFDGMSVSAGDFLEIDMRTKTIRLNGDPTAARNQFLVFPDSSWWTLQPGEQRIRFEAETFTAPAQAQIIWRDAYS